MENVVDLTFGQFAKSFGFPVNSISSQYRNKNAGEALRDLRGDFDDTVKQICGRAAARLGAIPLKKIAAAASVVISKDIENLPLSAIKACYDSE
jgi:hypothetical protein